jgi:hypothetical protein
LTPLLAASARGSRAGGDSQVNPEAAIATVLRYHDTAYHHRSKYTEMIIYATRILGADDKLTIASGGGASAGAVGCRGQRRQAQRQKARQSLVNWRNIAKTVTEAFPEVVIAAAGERSAVAVAQDRVGGKDGAAGGGVLDQAGGEGWVMGCQRTVLPFSRSLIRHRSGSTSSSRIPSAPPRRHAVSVCKRRSSASRTVSLPLIRAVVSISWPSPVARPPDAETGFLVGAGWRVLGQLEWCDTPAAAGRAL